MNHERHKREVAGLNRKIESQRKEIGVLRGELQDRQAVERLLRNQLAALAGMSHEQVDRFVKDHIRNE
jgi:hypothetical protein